MGSVYIGSKYALQKWTGKGDFLGACMCNVFGMAHIWKFPYLVYKNGGGAFLIPYLLCLVSLGIPVMLLELTLGQFSSAGPVNCWGFCPLFSGCGISMATVSFLTGIYYAVLVSWSILFFLASIAYEEPWRKCGPWSTPTCSDTALFLNTSQCLTMNLTAEKDGTCSDPLKIRNGTYIWNYEVAKKYGLIITFPANEYFDGAILESRGHSIENPGDFRVPIVLTLLLTWILVWLFLIRGIHISAKMLIRTMLLPILIFIILAARGLILDGSKDGIMFFIIPEHHKIYSIMVWDEAAKHVFFTLSASYGGLIALARYNDFHYNIFRDIIIISVVDTVVSLAVGVMLFSFLGFVAKKKHIQISDVTPSGPGMTFKIMPMALSDIPGTTFWCAVFFLMIVFLSLGSQIIYIETVISSFIDFKPEFTRKKFLTITSVCCLMFILGLPMTTQGGKAIVALLDEYCTGRNLYIIALCECIAVGWVYGANRFLNDVDMMLGRKFCRSHKFNTCCHVWFHLSWKIVTPCFIVFIIYNAKYGSHTHADFVKYPPWTDEVGWVITGLCTISILLVAVYRLLIARGSLMQRLKITTSPSAEWGPALVKHRYLVKKYVPSFVVRPSLSSYGGSQRTTDELQPMQTLSLLTDPFVSESAFTEEVTDSTSVRQSIPK